MNISAVIASLSLIVISASACTVNMPNAQVATPTPIPSQVVAQRYTNILVLRAAAVANGFPCPTWEDQSAWSTFPMGTCTGEEDPMSRLTLIEWSDDLSTKNAENLSANNGEGLKTNMLWGPGWVVMSNNYDDITALSIRMGGTVAKFI